MIIGLPKEIKIAENRVAMPPHGVAELVKRGHRVVVQQGAGVNSGFADAEYLSVGAELLPTAADVWQTAQMVIKVKEPQPSEYAYLREDLILFTYLHLAADETLTRALLASGVTGIAYETVEDKMRRLPLLEPMSEVAGRMASQVVSHYLEKHAGGRGVLMGGVAGVPPANIVILGGGTVGTEAAKMALGMGANVTILDINLERLRYLDDMLHGRFTTLYSSSSNVQEVIQRADGIIGAVLIAGARAPKLVTREMLTSIPDGAVIVDVAVDQGGCVETTHATTHEAPTYVIDGVVHYGVANMPGAVPRTSSLALSNATLPYVIRLAGKGVQAALSEDVGLLKGLNVLGGKLTYQAVAEAFGMGYTAPNLTAGVHVV